MMGYERCAEAFKLIFTDGIPRRCQSEGSLETLVEFPSRMGVAVRPNLYIGC